MGREIKWADNDVVISLRKKIDKDGRTHSQFANLVGVSPNFFSQIMSGRAKIPTDRVDDFAEVFGYDPKRFRTKVNKAYVE